MHLLWGPRAQRWPWSFPGISSYLHSPKQLNQPSVRYYIPLRYYRFHIGIILDTRIPEVMEQKKERWWGNTTFYGVISSWIALHGLTFAFLAYLNKFVIFTLHRTTRMLHTLHNEHVFFHISYFISFQFPFLLPLMFNAMFGIYVKRHITTYESCCNMGWSHSPCFPPFLRTKLLARIHALPQK